jgi:lipopolysaccharide transport system ATP-binding protein
MSGPIITVENLSKCYRIGLRQRGYRTFREAITDGLKAPISNFRRLRKLTKFDEGLRRNKSPDLLEHTPSSIGSSEDDLIWALRQISFEVKEGEVVGIIGRNGAGKSTLLKILSRITEPTHGDVKLYGRVSSLLEVGTGFHPELTGRENIYLNGAILGMRKDEIEYKFDEIVDFAGIAKFIDTPVKRYSSGMYVRLAFAVAAHLEPEILLVDEVLAVGDAQFQKKCIGKMSDIAIAGRTVLFVSHNLASISKLCGSAIWLDDGKVRLIAEAEEAVECYLASLASGQSAHEGRVVFDLPEDSKEAFILSIELRNKYGDITSRFDVSSPIKVDIGFCCKRKFVEWRIFVSVSRYDGVTVFSTTTWDYNTERHPIEPGTYHASLLVPGRFLGSSNYLMTVAFGEPPLRRHDLRENVIHFEVSGQPFDYGRNIGLLAYPFEWQVNKA